jgi:hypothetical protein
MVPATRAVQAALFTVSLLLAGAEPVEALSPLSVTFRLHGYQFGN